MFYLGEWTVLVWRKTPGGGVFAVLSCFQPALAYSSCSVGLFGHLIKDVAATSAHEERLVVHYFA